MYSTSSIVSSSLTNLHIKPCIRSQTLFFNPFSHLKIPKHTDGCFFPSNQSLQRAQRDNKSKTDFIVYSGDQSGDLIPFSNYFLENWKGWLLGLLATIILPLLTNKWGPLLKLKSEVDTAEATAEAIAETVEKVAEQVEKVAEDVADALPEGGKLRNAATFVENVAKETEKGADLAEKFIDKVEQVEKDLVSHIESNATGKVASDQK